MSKSVVVVGGGWAGCAAALSAAVALGRRGRVTLLERTDMLLGLGLSGGIFRNNGRYVAAEECLALGGGGDLIRLMDENARHRDVEFPGHKHASLYDVNSIEPAVRAVLNDAGVEVRTQFRVGGVTRSGGRLTSVLSSDLTSPTSVAGDTFVDATGTAGPPGNCVQHGKGCGMCIMRCPAFGPRRGLAELAGLDELSGTRPSGGGLGSLSGSCDLRPESLDAEVLTELTDKGVVVKPMDEALHDHRKLGQKSCQQYNLPEYGVSLVLLDTGVVKMMSPYLPVNQLRKVPGMGRAIYEAPLAGGMANAIRFIGMAPHSLTLRVSGLSNLFCAGEKSGPAVGHTEAVATGALAGHNAARIALGLSALILPSKLATGDFIAALTLAMRAGDLGLRLTFAGADFFLRMRQRGTYTQDRDAIHGAVAGCGLVDAFAKPLT